MSRLLVLIAITLTALASELGGQAHRCVWVGLPRHMRTEKKAKKQE